MGQAISSFKESLQQSAEKEKLANDAMNSLIEIAQTKLSNFYTQICSPNFDAKLVPIEAVLDKFSVVRCQVSEKPDDIGSEITKSFSDFASGDIAKGISSVLSAGLKLVFGTYQGNMSEESRYMIATGELGGIWRIDTHIFAYRYTSEQLTVISKNVVAISVVISSADISQLSNNTLSVIVQKFYGSLPKDEQTAILKQLIAARDGTQPTKALGAKRLRLAAAKLNKRIIGSNGAVDMSGSVKPSHATVELTFRIGQATENTEGIRSWVTSALDSKFRFVETAVAQPDQDSVDQKLVLTALASGSRKHKKESLLQHNLVRNLDKCLYKLINSDDPTVPLIGYRFLWGAEAEDADTNGLTAELAQASLTPLETKEGLNGVNGIH